MHIQMEVITKIRPTRHKQIFQKFAATDARMPAALRPLRTEAIDCSGNQTPVVDINAFRLVVQVPEQELQTYEVADSDNGDDDDDDNDDDEDGGSKPPAVAAPVTQPIVVPAPVLSPRSRQFLAQQEVFRQGNAKRQRRGPEPDRTKPPRQSSVTQHHAQAHRDAQLPGGTSHPAPAPGAQWASAHTQPVAPVLPPPRTPPPLRDVVACLVLNVIMRGFVALCFVLGGLFAASRAVW